MGHTALITFLVIAQTLRCAKGMIRALTINHHPCSAEILRVRVKGYLEY